MIDSARCLILHLEQKVKLITRLVKYVRDLVPALRDAKVIRIIPRILICDQKIIGRLCPGNSIFPIVSGIMPAAVHFLCLIGTVDRSGRSMAGRMGKFIISPKGNGCPAALGIEHQYGIPERLVVKLFPNLKGEGTSKAVHIDIIFPGRLKL